MHKGIKHVWVQILKACVALKKGENCLLITDFQGGRLSKTLAQTIDAFGGIPVVLSLPKEVYTKEPLPRNVEAALTSSEVVILQTGHLFPHQPRHLAAQAGARVLSLCAVTEDVALRALDINYYELSKVTHRIAMIFSNAKEICVRSGNGEELRAAIAKQPVICLDGLAREPGQISALPAGMVTVLPVPGSAQGRIVLNGSLAQFRLLRTPITLEVKDGQVVRVSGGKEAKNLNFYLAKPMKTHGMLLRLA